MKLNTKRNILSDFSGKLSGNLKKNKKQGPSILRRFYQIDENDIDSYFFRKAASPMSVDEVLVVKANSSSEASAYLEAAQAHLESQKNIFEGYGTDQMALLGEASVEKRGAYVWYFCGENAQELRQALLSMI